MAHRLLDACCVSTDRFMEASRFGLSSSSPEEKRAAHFTGMLPRALEACQHS